MFLKVQTSLSPIRHLCALYSLKKRPVKVARLESFFQAKALDGPRLQALQNGEEDIDLGSANDRNNRSQGSQAYSCWAGRRLNSHRDRMKKRQSEGGRSYRKVVLMGLEKECGGVLQSLLDAHKLRDLLMMICVFQSERKLEVYVENQSW